MTRLPRPLALLLAAVALAACSRTTLNTTPGEGFSPPTSTIAVLPSVPPLGSPTEPPPFSEEGETGDRPIDVAGYELVAIGAGESVYSGYTCTIAPVGCACDQPLVQRATFEFVNETTMRYTFSGGGFGSEWLLARLAPNQWGYEIGMVDDEGVEEGVYFVLLTFTEDGFIITQGANLDEGGMIACPDVYFRRVQSGGTAEP